MTNYRDILSGKYFELLGHLEERPDARSMKIDLDCEDAPYFMRDYPYLLGTWPVILPAHPPFDTFVEHLPALCYKVIRLEFADDSAAFSSYFDLPPVLYHALKEMKVDTSEILIRYDGAFSGGEFKLIEINTGSGIGGWQQGWIAGLYSDALRRLPQTRDWNIRQCQVSQLIFDHLTRSIGKIKGAAATGNILWFSKNEFPRQAHFERSFVEFYDRIKPARFKGGLHFIDSLDDIEISKSGRVVYAGKIMDAVMLPMLFYGYDGSDLDIPEMSDELVYRLGASHMIGNICYVDSPFYSLLANKRLLSLLHKHKDNPRLAPLERELLNRHVPWCHRLSDGVVVRHGERHDMKTLALARKDDFVLKKSASCQGRDVVVGAKMKQDRWEELLDGIEDERDWIVQEFCAIDPVDYCSPQGNVTPHDFIWGVFSSGDRYGGTFIRAVPSGTGDGVINSDRGALEVPVFAECAPAA